MKTLIILAGVLFFWISAVEAQVIPTTSATPAKSSTTVTKTTAKKTTSQKSKFDADKSIGKANDAVNKTSQTANNATDLLSTTANKAKDLVHKIIPPKQPAAGVPTNSTDIVVKGGLTFAALSKLNDNVQACPGVQKSTMKFSSSKSTITVTHSGTTADLLKQIETRSGDVFTNDNVSDFKEGKISIKIKSN